MRRLLLIFFFFAFLGFGLKAQNDDVIDFTDTSVSGDSDSKEESNDSQDSIFGDIPNYEINFQLLHLIRNKFNLEYRKNVNDLFSMGLGVGYNYDQDNILHISSEAEYIYELDDYSLSTLLRNGAHKFGFNINPSLRFFYDSYFFENAFVQLDYRYNFSRYYLNQDTPELNLKTNLYSSSASLIFGIKGNIFINKNISLINTAYYGIGGRYFTTFGIDNNTIYELKDPIVKENSVSFRLIIGYSIGLGIKK
tara:strand:- start:404 stop:1156 length:753 start_codon:yes stop_codon:yes gene_type:complete